MQNIYRYAQGLLQKVACHYKSSMRSPVACHQRFACHTSSQATASVMKTFSTEQAKMACE